MRTEVASTQFGFWCDVTPGLIEKIGDQPVAISSLEFGFCLRIDNAIFRRVLDSEAREFRLVEPVQCRRNSYIMPHLDVPPKKGGRSFGRPDSS